MNKFLSIVQIFSSVVLISSILMQQKGTGLSGIFGGDGGGGAYQTKRGMEKIFFYATIASATVLFGSAILILIY